MQTVVLMYPPRFSAVESLWKGLGQLPPVNSNLLEVFKVPALFYRLILVDSLEAIVVVILEVVEVLVVGVAVQGPSEATLLVR